MSTPRLLLCKSQVYSHPTRNSSDNIHGFILITKELGAIGKDASLMWIAEKSLNVTQIRWLLKAEMTLIAEYDNMANNSKSNLNNKRENKGIKMNSTVLNALQNSQYGTFSIRLGSLYSIEFRSPSHSGWWFGSIVLHSLTPQEDSTMPILFFHDDLCPSTIERQKLLSKSFDPFTNNGDVYWGAVDVRERIGSLVDLQKTFVDPTIWLINATLDDLRNFSPQKSQNDEENEPNESNLWNKWESTKWSIMSHIASATTKTTDFMTDLIKKHPIVKLVDQNRDNILVKQMLSNPKVIEIQDDFDSARVYLAKWSLGVKEEADRYQLNHKLGDSYKRLLNNDLGFDISEDAQFSELELNKATQRQFPLTRQKWESFFDSHGRLSYTVNEVKDFIFHGGISDNELRKEVWLFLLGVYPWDSSHDERLQILATLKESYLEYKNQWLFKVSSFENEEEIEEEEQYWKDQVFRIEKDVLRNDRNVDIYKYNTDDGEEPPNLRKTANLNGNVTEDDNTAQDNNTTETLSNSDHWTINNPHLLILRDILKSYNVYNDNLGYVQGMCDLLSPLYYIMRDETLSFWCFVKFMERMERNFLRDQSGIRDQMLTLTELTSLMLPKLSEHLIKCDSSNLFFCFRMLLVWFKREFEFDDVCSIWEIFWTDYYSSQMQLFFMLAILQKNSDPILQNLNQFDQVLKYFNDLHNTMEWNDLMTRSELLFIRFQKLMSTMDRQQEHDIRTHVYTSGVEIHDEDDNEDSNISEQQLPNNSKLLRQLLSRQMVTQRESKRSKDSIK